MMDAICGVDHFFLLFRELKKILEITVNNSQNFCGAGVA
jgi:hypothetical protein